MVSSSLATAVLPREMFKFQGKEISFKIGNLIPYKNYNMPNISPKEEIGRASCRERV